MQSVPKIMYRRRTFHIGYRTRLYIRYMYLYTFLSADRRLFMAQWTLGYYFDLKHKRTQWITCYQNGGGTNRFVSRDAAKACVMHCFLHELIRYKITEVYTWSNGSVNSVNTISLLDVDGLYI